jgi:hypothetical protein
MIIRIFYFILFYSNLFDLEYQILEFLIKYLKTTVMIFHYIIIFSNVNIYFFSYIYLPLRNIIKYINYIRFRTASDFGKKYNDRIN